MEQVELKSVTRDRFGKEETKKYRDQGMIPVVLYSKGKETQHILVKETDLLKCLNTESGAHVIFNLSINDKVSDTAIIQELDRHPVSRRIRHLDFLHIDLSKEIETEIDIRLVGTAPGVKQGGEMMQRIKKIKIKCLPDNLPKHFDVDITTLEMGAILRIVDIQQPNIVITHPVAETVIVTIEKPKGMDETEEGAAAAAAPAPAKGKAKK